MSIVMTVSTALSLRGSSGNPQQAGRPVVDAKTNTPDLGLCAQDKRTQGLVGRLWIFHKSLRCGWQVEFAGQVGARERGFGSHLLSPTPHPKRSATLETAGKLRQRTQL